MVEHQSPGEEEVDSYRSNGRRNSSTNNDDDKSNQILQAATDSDRSDHTRQASKRRRDTTAPIEARRRSISVSRLLITINCLLAIAACVAVALPQPAALPEQRTDLKHHYSQKVNHNGDGGGGAEQITLSSGASGGGSSTASQPAAAIVAVDIADDPDGAPASSSSSSASISDSPAAAAAADDKPAASSAGSVGEAAAAAARDENQDETAIENATLLIDYNQQSYRSIREPAAADEGTPTAAAPTVLPTTASTAAAAAASVATTTASPPSAAAIDRRRDDASATIVPVERAAISTDNLERSEQIDMDGRYQKAARMLGRSSGGGGGGQDGKSTAMRDAVLKDTNDKLNASNILATLFKKKPYSKYWSAEQKWDDIFKRFMAVQASVKSLMTKNFLRDVEYYADVSISQRCADDLKYIQTYVNQKATNMRWLTHMFDATGKSEPGMLTGNLANLGHVVQCIKVRAPARPTNETFEERYFERQAAQLGERFRGKYCLASLRPVMPEKPRLVSRFSEILDARLLSNVSYMGEPGALLKLRARDSSPDRSVHARIARDRPTLDQVPFESELYQYLIAQRNFIYTLPRFMGVCYPSSCTKDDIRFSVQKSVDEQHQVVDVEFECELDESDAWRWFSTPRLVIYMVLFIVVGISLGASLARHILVDRLQLKRLLNRAGNDGGGSKLGQLIATLDIISMDKCAGILFIKTRPASPLLDEHKLENNRSTSIDALKGFLVLILIYSELVHLGCLPIPFMWAKWGDAMFPFYRAYWTQPFLNTSIWSEAFYIISAYLIGLKLLEDHRPVSGATKRRRLPEFGAYVAGRYIRLVLPMLAFILFHYVWPRLSNGFVMQDQAEKLLAPCDSHGWTNMLLLHNHYALNETCLWPTHVSASFFQLHVLSYPLLILFLFALRTSPSADFQSSSSPSSSPGAARTIIHRLLVGWALGLTSLLALFGLVYSAFAASGEQLIVPFLIDYIDYDNYQRVIEWTVMPTHNHLTSYMVGLLMAFMVARSRMKQENQPAAAAKSRGQTPSHEVDKSTPAAAAAAYMVHRENSLELVVPSPAAAATVQLELNFKPAFTEPSGGERFNRLAPAASSVASTTVSSVSAASSLPSSPSSSSSSSSPSPSSSNQAARRLCRACADCALVALILASLTASWLWTGLGQPMTHGQTFWYMICTKLVFTLAFASLFYRHFATRRNSTNPWMITRFLVPIGRMSLMLFYVSWPVIWFDLLSSLYQWHPSHYFVFEKYNEIIFMALVLSLLAYGAFEGTVKIIQYQGQARRQKATTLATTCDQSSDARRDSDAEQQQRQSGPQLTGFDSLFQPNDGGWLRANEIRPAKELVDYGSLPTGKSAKTTTADNQMFSKAAAAAAAMPLSGGNALHQGENEPPVNRSATATSTAAATAVASAHHGGAGSGEPTARTTTKPTLAAKVAAAAAASSAAPADTGRRRLSIADQYKLNAELRANNSFASIGLYESAGATDDLLTGGGGGGGGGQSQPDPQVSPVPGGGGGGGQASRSHKML